MGGRDSSGVGRGAGKVAAEEQRDALTPEKVLAEALVIVEREGLTALTMRRLAAELGVQAPTVYWHVGNRQELLTRLTRRLTDELGNFSPRATTRQSASRRSCSDFEQRFALDLI
jgi:AcrR family transcriptional regulator